MTVDFSTLDASTADDSAEDVSAVPLNGTDARRRLEDRLEERRLRREIREFDFD